MLLKMLIDNNNQTLTNFKKFSGLSQASLNSLNKKNLSDWKLEHLNILANFFGKTNSEIIAELEILSEQLNFLNVDEIGAYNLENRRYIGNKNKILNWIIKLINEHTNGNSFFDVFAGTGVVSKGLMFKYDRLILNDFLYSNEIIYKAFFESSKYSITLLKKIKKEFNSINSNSLEENYFSDNYGGKYFSKNDSKKIGYIREEIELNQSLNQKEKTILIASLIYSVDKISNTVGHYDAFRSNHLPEDKFYFDLVNPIDTKNKEIEIYREDANKLSKKIKCDVAFVDPPYNSRQYSRFYHLLENLVTWKKPTLSGKAKKPPVENVSQYSKIAAPIVFDDLINSINSKYIVVTYNNTYNSKSSSSINKITHDQIKSSLDFVGHTKIFEKKHSFFNSGKTKFNNHKEFLFITKVK